MIHELKIKQCYLIHILEGRKTFEVRKNDRDFQVGDTIRFLPLEDEDYDCHEVWVKINGVTAIIPDYRIDYILTDFNGLQQNHIAMSIKPII